MPIVLINSKGTRTVDGKKISYPRRKMVVGNYELGDSETVATGPKPDEKGFVAAGYPTFKEVADFCKGAVEFQLKDGKETADSVLGFFRDGWNSAESLSAWGQTPEAAMAKINNAIEKFAANDPKKRSKEEIRKLLGL